MGRPSVAIVHDYLTQRGGAERIVLSMRRAFPEAPIYTSLYDPEATFPEFQAADVRTAAIDRVPILRHHHRLALPLLARTFSRMRVDAEVALCSSSGWAHGCAAAGRKVVYLYTPARWLYQTQAYVGEDRGGLRRAAVAVLGGGLRAWDRRAAASADRWLTQSRATRERIQEAYGVDAEILPGPWTLDPGGLQEAPPGLRDRSPGFGLLVSRLLPYKNVAQAVEAMRALPERRLVVVGSGPERARLEALAPPGVELVGAVGDAGLRWLYARSAFLLAAAYEDYGLTPLEAAAFGRPSAVLRWGGFLDTVREGQTGVFFDRPEPGEIAAAVQRLLGRAWDSELIAAHAQRYSEERFIARLRAVVEEELGHVASPGQPAAVGEGQ